MSLSVAGQTDPGRVRAGNEDALLAANLRTGERWTGPAPAAWGAGADGVVIAVSDGMGGAKAGEVASAMCIDGLYRWMTKGSDGEAPRSGRMSDADDIERLRRVVEAVSNEVREAASRSDRRGMGATLTVVLVRGTMAYVAEVGDSRAYLIRGHTICQVTRDQSYVQMLVDAGAITPEAAEHSPRKNLIMQVMGQRDELMVALCRFELMRGDRLLLCSDGLSNMVKDDRIREIAAAPADVAEACAALINEANAAGGDDNITVVLAAVEGEGLRDPRPSQEGRTAEAIDTVQEFKL